MNLGKQTSRWRKKHNSTCGRPESSIIHKIGLHHALKSCYKYVTSKKYEKVVKDKKVSEEILTGEQGWTTVLKMYDQEMSCKDTFLLPKLYHKIINPFK